MPTANITNSLKAGILADLKEMWRQKMPVFQKIQEKLLKFVPDNNIRNATWAWKETVPFPVRWDYGTSKTYQTFKDRYVTLGKIPYELTIPWNRFDEEDDLLGDLRPHIQTAVTRFGMLPDVLISEFFIGTATLNPAITLAYDGVALFSAVDGDGANRFGVSGGNIISGYPLTPSGVTDGMFAAQQQFLGMTDPTSGKPIFAPEDVTLDKLFVIGPKQANQVIAKAAEAEFLKIDSGNVVSESNIMKGKFFGQVNPYLTDAYDWYVVVDHPYWKPFIYRAPKNVEAIIADINNSDIARNTGENAIHTVIRTALGIWAPHCIIKVNN